MNEEEAATASNVIFGMVHSCGTLCRLLVEKYPEISVICISKEPGGAAVFHKGVYEEVKTSPIKVADTVGAGDVFVGAGDVFSAGFLCTYLSGYCISKAASIACILGTYVALNHGSVPGYSEERIKK
jgi:fructokinase